MAAMGEGGSFTVPSGLVTTSPIILCIFSIGCIPRVKAAGIVDDPSWLVKNVSNALQASSKREVAGGKQQVETGMRALGCLVPGEKS